MLHGLDQATTNSDFFSNNQDCHELSEVAEQVIKYTEVVRFRKLHIVKLKSFNLWQPTTLMPIKADEVFYYKQPGIKGLDASRWIELHLLLTFIDSKNRYTEVSWGASN